MNKSFFKKIFTYLFVIALSSSVLCIGCSKDNNTSTPSPSQGQSDGVPGWNKDAVFYDNEQWTKAVVGSMPLVISVPHGGTLRPDELPDRSCSGSVVVTDQNTIDVAEEISDALYERYSVRPYLVICNLARKKIDQNRAIDDPTACMNDQIKSPWNNFHDYIDTAVEDAIKKYGKVLYIDLHGHGHANQRLEIGYSLTSDDLGGIFYNNKLNARWKSSSLKNLDKLNSADDFREYIVGEKAFGSIISEHGFDAVPSVQDPFPEEGAPFFSGGYNGRRYTDTKYKPAFGFQIEMPSEFRQAKRTAFAAAFAPSIIKYMDDTMQYEP